MTRDADYLLRVAVPDMAALERFIVERLSPMHRSIVSVLPSHLARL